MHILPLSAVTVPPDRQRQFFDSIALADLQTSIEEIGLLQPVVVTAEGLLVAGERRRKAIEGLHMLGIPFSCQGQPVPQDKIPCLYVGELDAARLFQAELDENTKRAPLTWQEEAEAVRRLHTIRQSLSGGVHAHTITATTRELYPKQTEGKADGELGQYRDTVRKQVIVANHLANPAVAKAKSVDEAFKVLKREEDAATNLERGKAAANLTLAERHTLLKGDCIALMEEWRERFDLIVTDPPYGMGADKFGNAGGLQEAKHGYDDSLEEFELLISSFAAASYRVAKPQAHLYLWCDLDNYHYIKAKMQQAGWLVHRTPIIYHKPDGSRVPWLAVGLQRKWEMVLFACKGYRPLNTMVGDLFACMGDDNLGHGAQKPVAAYAEILKRSARSGDHVLDAFAGTGGLLPAAHKAGCRATLIERDETAFGIILGRMEGLK